MSGPKCTLGEGFTHQKTHVGIEVHASGNTRWGQCDSVQWTVSVSATIVHTGIGKTNIKRGVHASENIRRGKMRGVYASENERRERGSRVGVDVYHGECPSRPYGKPSVTILKLYVCVCLKRTFELKWVWS